LLSDEGSDDLRLGPARRVERPFPGRKRVRRNLAEGVIGDCVSRVAVTCFASNVARVESVALALRYLGTQRCHGSADPFFAQSRCRHRPPAAAPQNIAPIPVGDQTNDIDDDNLLASPDYR
jgi:hypothetical protein